jgi:hypothetical protein
MVRPSNFGFNPETAQNNAFQNNISSLTTSEISLKAIEEFDVMVEGLRNLGVKVIVIEDTVAPKKTDAVYPNNWFTTHSSGELYLYPMYSTNRRLERRADVVKRISEEFHLEVNESILREEDGNRFLEGTGSIILDRPNKLIYACYSERTNRDLLAKYAMSIDYEPIGFHAEDQGGTPYYHTNVIMALGKNVAVLCTESIVNEIQRLYVIDRLSKTGKDIVEISRDQVLSFAGNMLEVLGKSEKPILVMSTSAFKSLTVSQKQIIEKHDIIFHSPLSTIEKFGGGSARCMMAEIFSKA